MLTSANGPEPAFLCYYCHRHSQTWWPQTTVQWLKVCKLDIFWSVNVSTYYASAILTLILEIHACSNPSPLFPNINSGYINTDCRLTLPRHVNYGNTNTRSMFFTNLPYTSSCSIFKSNLIIPLKES